MIVGSEELVKGEFFFFFLVKDKAIFLYYDGNYIGKPKITCRKER